MDTLETALEKKERQLEELLARMDNPELRQLLSEINILKQSIKIVAGLSPATPSESAAPNGYQPASSTPNVATQGDAIVEILQNAGRPMHVDDIRRELQRYGFTPKKTNLVSNIRKDRRERFVPVGGNVYALRESERISNKPSTRKPSTSKNGHGSNLSKMGFSLIGAIKELLPKMSGEFGQPHIYEILRRENPKAAPFIQKASIATTLRKMADDGLIEVTHKGYGSDPRRYRRKG